MNVIHLESPCFTLDPQTLFSLQLEACLLLPISPNYCQPWQLLFYSLFLCLALFLFFKIPLISDTMQYLSFCVYYWKVQQFAAHLLRVRAYSRSQGCVNEWPLSPQQSPFLVLLHFSERESWEMMKEKCPRNLRNLKIYLIYIKDQRQIYCLICTTHFNVVYALNRWIRCLFTWKHDLWIWKSFVCDKYLKIKLVSQLLSGRKYILSF